MLVTNRTEKNHSFLAKMLEGETIHGACDRIVKRFRGKKHIVSIGVAPEGLGRVRVNVRRGGDMVEMEPADLNCGGYKAEVVNADAVENAIQSFGPPQGFTKLPYRPQDVREIAGGKFLVTHRFICDDKGSDNPIQV